MLNPWDVYDLNNAELLAAYNALLVSGADATASNFCTLKAAIEREMSERSLSYSVVAQIENIIDKKKGGTGVSPVGAVGPPPGSAVKTADTVKTEDVERGSSLGQVPPEPTGSDASTFMTLVARPPWYVDPVVTTTAVASSDHTDVDAGSAAAAVARPRIGLWDDGDENDDDSFKNTGDQPEAKIKRKGRRKNICTAVMNKLGFFVTVLTDAEKAAIKKSKLVAPPATIHKKPGVPRRSSSSNHGVNKAPQTMTVPRASEPVKSRSKNSVPTPKNSNTSAPSSRPTSTSTGGSSSNPASRQQSSRKPAAQGSSSSKATSDPADEPPAFLDIPAEAPESDSAEDDDTGEQVETEGEGKPLPAWLQETSQPPIWATPVAMEDAVSDAPVLKLNYNIDLPSFLRATPASRSSAHDDGESQQQRQAEEPTRASSAVGPVVLRKDEAAAAAGDVHSQRSVSAMNIIDATVSSQSAKAAPPTEVDKKVDALVSSEPQNYASSSLVVTSAISSNGNSPLRVARPSKVPLPHFSSIAGAADYSPFFPTLAHLLVDPTHLSSYAMQPINVSILAIGLLQQATQNFIHGLERVNFSNENCSLEEIVRGRRRLYKVQQDREEVYDLISMVLEEAIEDAPWSEIGGWPKEDSSDDEKDAPAQKKKPGSKSTAHSNKLSDVLSGDDAPDFWSLWWTWGKPRPKPKSVWLATQLVNHIPKSVNLTRKDLLKSHVQRFTAGHRSSATSALSFYSSTSTAPQDGKPAPSTISKRKSSSMLSSAPLPAMQHSILPLTFNLPAEYVEFASVFAETGGTWILKTVGLSRGRGISLVTRIDDVNYSDASVIQRYVDRPLLVDGGYKFDFRIYVLVKQFSPVLEAYVSTLGFMRIAAHKYNMADTNDKFSHLTNTSISNQTKRDASSTNAKKQSFSEKIGSRSDCKWTLSKCKEYFEANKTISNWQDDVWGPLCSTILKTLVCVQDSIPAQASAGATLPSCTFELFGFDILLDENLKPWVLEVNASPSMEVETDVDRCVKPQLILDVVNLLDPIAVDMGALSTLLQRPDAARLLVQSGNPASSNAGSTNGRHNSSTPGKAVTVGQGKRELDALLHAVFQGRVPRTCGTTPQTLGSFEALAPSAAYDAALRWKRGA